MKIDFTHVIDFIFKNRANYSKLTDKDKETFFWIINRKFGVNYIKQANFFNSKFIDKSSAMDLWFRFFKNSKGIPNWYWAKSKGTKTSNKISPSDRKLLIENSKMTNKDIDFMAEYYMDDLAYELKKLKRLE